MNSVVNFILHAGSLVGMIAAAAIFWAMTGGFFEGWLALSLVLALLFGGACVVILRRRML